MAQQRSHPARGVRRIARPRRPTQPSHTAVTGSSAGGRYEAISRLISDYVFEMIITPDGRRELVWTGGSFGTIVGYSVEEGLRMPFRAVVYPDDLPIYDRYNEQMLQGLPAEIEVRVIHRDGRLLWLRITARPEPLADQPGALRVYGAGRDITALKQAEAALAASEVRYRNAVEMQIDQVCRLSVPDYRITFVNDAYCRFNRKSREQLVGMRLVDLIPVEIQAEMLAQLDAVTPERPFQVVEATTRGPDGQVCTRQWHDRAIFDGEGRFVEIQSVGRDITELKGIEGELRALNAGLEARVLARTADLAALNASLRAGEALLRVLVDSLADGLALVDGDGVMIVANRALGALCERPQNELLGRGWLELGLPGSALLAETLADGAPRAERLSVGLPSGRRLVLDVQALPLAEGRHGRQQLLIRLSDVTERLQIERVALENERLAASGRLAATVAHEVNSPLQAIQNLLFVAAQDDLAAPERAQLLGLAGDEIARVSEILRRLLSLSQASNGSAEPVDCNHVLERVLLLTARSLERRRVRVVRELAPQPVVVSGRADQLTQVLLNLVLNALDAMPQGGTLTVGSTRDECAPRPGIIVVVCDTGNGIAAEDQERIFASFFTTKREGTGLGLAVSRQIVEAHGGTLSVSSAPGAGASFMIRLPEAPERA